MPDGEATADVPVLGVTAQAALATNPHDEDAQAALTRADTRLKVAGVTS